MTKSKKLIIIMGILLLLGLVGSGGYFLGVQNNKPKSITSISTETVTKIPSPTFQVPSPTPLISPTTVLNTDNWEIHTDSKLGISFKYPDSYTLETTPSSQTSRYVVSLKQNTTYTGGFGNGQTLQKGIEISFELYPYTEKEFEDAYSRGKELRSITVDGKEGKEVEHRENTTITKDIYFPKEKEGIILNLSNGFENTLTENESNLADFNQILSTVTFVN